ncbi:hypothetical protein DNU06_16415 [Putridiphycobacter roseus]|uniref:Uncharacterized protein n=1 Tax=Putridiphycobacter roseus TaxID=2219161 RepID=A0A2W1MUL9_9FLAO|nr:hypothetical protein [Putridiphycobacter roseus]PZE15759.1 hypothetical protein DNU06_16415 [Putridiphycobacter roseus]
MKQLIIGWFIWCSVFTFGQGRVDGFLKGKGNLDIALGSNYEANKQYYAGNNLINLSRDILSFSAFFAYGITDKLDVNFSVPYVSVNSAEKSIQDPALFIKYHITSISLKAGDHNLGKLNLIFAAGFSANINDYQTAGGNAIGQQAKTIDLRPVIHYQANSGWFATLQGGYNYKFEPVPDAIPFALKVGLAKAKWYADVWYDGQHGIGGFDYLGTPAPPSFRELGVSYHKIGGTFYKPINQYLGVFGGLSYMLAGRNISKGAGGNIGFVFKPAIKK